MKAKWVRHPVEFVDWHWYWDGNEHSKAIIVETIESARYPNGWWMPIEYPKRPGKQSPKSRPRNLVFDAVVQACGISEADLPVQASHVAKVASLLKEFSPDEILRRASIYHSKYPGYDLTPGALQKNWANCKEDIHRMTPLEVKLKIAHLKESIRSSPALRGGPYYTTLATEGDRASLMMLKGELRSLDPNFNFDELRH